MSPLRPGAPLGREDLARAVAEAVTAVPGVVGLASAGGVEMATQFAGGKVVGLRLSSDPVEVGIRIDRMPLPPVADAAGTAARRVLRSVGDERPVRVVVVDVVDEALASRGQG